jgi:oxalate decarboxylase/phosphoglucose isomerase-like protein (cupin superfamily)
MTTPFGPANLRRMTQGDVVTIPEGFVFGAHNDGKERFRLLAVGDRTTGQVEALQNYTVTGYTFFKLKRFPRIS